MKGADKTNLPCHNSDKTERQLAKIICEEIEVVYTIFGIITITAKSILYMKSNMSETGVL